MRGRARDPASLAARPTAPATPATATGLVPLGLDAARDSFLYVPSGYRPDRPAPLVVMLHGAGGVASGGLEPFAGRDPELGVLLLAPSSRQRTWDVLLGGYGPDVDVIDRSLARVFADYAVDPGRIAVEGFSDGASYALGIGLANGDLFSSVVAFSPGYAPLSQRTGKPRLFVSHGVADQVLPIDRCSRRIVPALQRAGYQVEYREFDGGHTVPPEIIDEAVRWLGLPS